MRQLERFLLLREEERKPLFYFLLVFFLIGAGLALGRGSANALFLKRYGIEYLPVMYLVLAGLLAATSALYAAFADRIAPERLLGLILAALGGLLLADWGLMRFTAFPAAYPFYFLLFEIASEILALHATLYFSANFDPSQNKRLLPLLFAGIQLGEICGGLLLASLAHGVGLENVLPVWSLLAIAAVLLLRWRHRRAGVSRFFTPSRRGGDQLRAALRQIGQGLKFARQSALLRYTSWGIFFMVVALYVLSYSVKAVYSTALPDEADLGALFGLITMVTASVALLIQVFFTNKLLHRFGVRRLNLVFPVATAICFLALLASPLFYSALLGSFNRRVVMPTIRNPSRNLLFDALPDYMQGRARALSLMLVLPLALATAGGALALLQRAAGAEWLLAIGLAAALLYLVFSVRANRAYLDTILTTLREKLFLPGAAPGSLGAQQDDRLFDELARGVMHSDERICLAYSKMLASGFPERAVEVIVQRLQDATVATRDQLIRLIALQLPAAGEVDLGFGRETADAHERSTVLSIQFERRDPGVEHLVEGCLRAGNPRLVACGIFGAYSYGSPHLLPEADRLWSALLASEQPGENLAGLDLAQKLPRSGHLPRILELLAHGSARVRKAALHALRNFAAVDPLRLAPLLEGLRADRDHQIRTACVECYRLLPEAQRRPLCLAALEDAHPRVSEAALRVLHGSGRDFEAVMTAWFIGHRASPRAQRTALEYLARLALPRHFFSAFAQRKIAQAQSLRDAIQALRQERSAALRPEPQDLLALVLGERLDQAIELALLGLENASDAPAARIIRAALKTRDRRQMARCQEALSNLDEREPTARLALLLQDHPQAPQRLPGAGFQSAAEVLQWCADHMDPWVRECAAHALGSRVPAGA